MSKITDGLAKVGAWWSKTSEKVNWKAVGTGLTITGAVIALVAGFAKDQNNEKIIKETARRTAVEELQRLLSETAQNHHTDG